MIKLAQDLLNAVVCKRVRELQEALSAGTIAQEITAVSQPSKKRWDRLSAGLDLILDQRGADMADLPGRRQRIAGARLQGQESRSAGDPNRPRRRLAGRRHARPRGAGRRGTGPVEDAPRGTQGDRRSLRRTGWPASRSCRQISICVGSARPLRSKNQMR
jgi:hypothetical protein